MAIRLAGPGDVPRLLEIERAAFGPSDRLGVEDMAAALEQPLTTAVLTDRRKVVAFATVVPARKTKLCVVNLAVDPARQRQGHGRRLIDWLRRRTEAAEVYSYVAAEWLPAQLWLRSLRFTCTDTVFAGGREFLLFSWLRPRKAKK